jgi:hypothetical protein
MLPGMLFHVCCECVRFVNLRAHRFVGLGTNMMGGHLLYKQDLGDGEAGHSAFVPAQASPFSWVGNIWHYLNTPPW